MWLAILTQTGIMGEAKNPAHIETEAFDSLDEAVRAMRRMFADKVETLTRLNELSFCEFNESEYEARVFGELAVIVIGVKNVNVRPKKEGGK